MTSIHNIDKKWIGFSIIFQMLTFSTSHAASPNLSTLSAMDQHSDLQLFIPARAETSSYPVWLSSERFDTLETAVVAASDRFNPKSIKEDRKYLGLILHYLHPTKSFYVYTVSFGDKGQDAVGLRNRHPLSYEIVAAWHTHGGEYGPRQYFSAADTQLANRWDVPIFLTDYTGSLLVYQPEQQTLTRMRAYSMGFGKTKGIAKGLIAAGRSGPIKIAVE